MMGMLMLDQTTYVGPALVSQVESHGLTWTSRAEEDLPCRRSLLGMPSSTQKT